MANKKKLSDVKDMFKGMEILSLEGVKIEGNIEIDLSGLMGGGMDPMLAAILGQESAMLAQHFGRIAGMFGVPVGMAAAPMVMAGYGAAWVGKRPELRELRLPFGCPVRVVQPTDIHAGLYMTRTDIRRIAETAGRPPAGTDAFRVLGGPGNRTSASRRVSRSR